MEFPHLNNISARMVPIFLRQVILVKDGKTDSLKMMIYGKGENF